MDFYNDTLSLADEALELPKGNQFVLAEINGFKVVMILETSSYLHRLEANQFSIFTQKFHKSISKTLKHFEGEVLKEDDHTYLVVFTSATNAVLCALKIHANFKYITPKFDKDGRRLKIGISSFPGDKTKSNPIFKAIASASRISSFVKDELVVSPGIKVLYEKENRNARIDRELVRVLKSREETFLNRLVTCCAKMYSNPDFNVTALGTQMQLGQSQLYRKVMRLTGKAPSNFIREYKLRRAIGRLHEHKHGTISQVARESGFRNPTYFSKCFNDRFGILPSKYIQQHSF
ncbi:MAG: helix-turn-helix domain-containing protein [Maribacter sp.]|nr:helix-turn-helix domain-containing protein [Maribacter sp.]